MFLIIEHVVPPVIGDVPLCLLLILRLFPFVLDKFVKLLELHVFTRLHFRSSLEALLRVLNEFHVYLLELMLLSLILFPCYTDLPVQLVGTAGHSVVDFLEEGAGSLL